MVGTETVKAVAGGLKSQPLAFALVLINVMFLAVGAWILRDVATNARDRDKMLTEIARDCWSDKKPDKDRR